jgi:hypothetical protein
MAKRQPVRIPETIADGMRMFTGESDRATAVLGGAYIEALLGRVLASWLITDREVERLFGNANQKVHLLFALGVITPRERDDLLLLQKVRNHFAHHVLDATNYEAEPVARLLRDLSIYDVWRDGQGKRYDGRGVFLMSVVYMANRLRGRVLPDRSEAGKRDAASELRCSLLPLDEMSLARAMAGLD